MLLLDACVDMATNVCRDLGPHGYLVIGLVYAAFQYWKHRDKVKRQEVVVSKVASVEQKVEKALSTPPPAAPSASSPALVPVVIPASPPPTDLLSGQVDGQSDRETKP